MRVLLSYALAVIIWLGFLAFTMGHITHRPFIKVTGPWETTANFYLYDQKMEWQGLSPQFVFHLAPRGGIGEVYMPVSFLEWVSTSKRDWNRGGASQIYTTDNAEYPFITSWGADHDSSMTWAIGAFRFNANFLMSGLLLVVYTVLFISWALAEGFKIETPAEKKQRYIDFVNNVRQAEEEAGRDLKAFKRKVILLAGMGYCVILGSVALLVILGVAIGIELFFGFGQGVGAVKIAIFAAIIPIGFAFHMIRTLFSDSYIPDGVRVDKAMCPSLFQVLESLQSRMQGPKFRKVYITPFMNASVSRGHGGLGFLGLGPVVLEIGSPLLQTLSVKEMAGVIAHEYGHVAARHNALGQWVYRIYGSWWELGGKFHLDNLWYAMQLNRFYRWFMGEFAGRSFVLSRQCEYEADSIAANLVGKENLAAALTRTNIFGRLFDSLFWGVFWDKAEQNGDINTIKPYENGWLSYLADESRESEKISERIRCAELEMADYSSTHPTTLDRLKNIGFDRLIRNLELPKDLAITLLDSSGANIIRLFDSGWQERNQEHWKAEKDRLITMRNRYEEYKNSSLSDVSDEVVAEAKSGAYLTNDFSFAVMCLAEFENRYPANIDVKLEKLSLQLLKLGDHTVLDDIISGALHGKDDRGRYAEILLSLYRAELNEPLVEKYQDIYDDWTFEMQAAHDERSYVLSTDVFTQHDVSADVIDKLAQCAERYKIIQKIFLVKKETQIRRDIPLYVIVYAAAPNAFSGQVDAEKLQAFINDMDCILPNSLYIGWGEVIGLSKKIKNINGAKIYSRKQWWG